VSGGATLGNRADESTRASGQFGKRPCREGRYHSPAERRTAADGLRSLAELWALKEAAWKALGLAPDLPFHALALEFDGARELRAVRLADARFAAHAVVARPWPRHLVAVVRVDG
jgi:phosphopantetheinyl transferase (holo-ACP synthase)